jgi:hypothetical protein
VDKFRNFADMKRDIKKVLIVLLPLMLYNCESCMESFYALKIENKSDFSIYFYVAGVSMSPYTSLYPDTAIISTTEYVSKLDTNAIGRYGIDELDKYFAYLPQDTLSVFFFHADTLATYPWEQIRQDYNVLCRYDLSADDIKHLNYKITYPPSEEMGGMKMYPPYP